MGEKGMEPTGSVDTAAPGAPTAGTGGSSMVGMLSAAGGMLGPASSPPPPPPGPSTGEQVVEAAEDVIDPLGVRKLF
jgi:hypothetical protein